VEIKAEIEKLENCPVSAKSSKNPSRRQNVVKNKHTQNEVKTKKV
jgi:hypothetical protein